MELDKFKIWINFWKYVIGIILGSALTAILGHVIKDRELKIQELQQRSEFRLTEQDNLSRYFKYTLEGDAYDRLKLSTFFSTVIEDTSARRRWTEYKEILTEQLDEFVQVKYKLDSIDQFLKLTGDTVLSNSKNYVLLEERYKRLEELLNPVKYISKLSSSNPLPPIDNTSSDPISNLLLERYYSGKEGVFGRLYDLSNGKDLIAYTLENKESGLQIGDYQIEFREEDTRLTQIYRRTRPWFTSMLHITPDPKNKYPYMLSGNKPEDARGGSIIIAKEVYLENDSEYILNSRQGFEDVYRRIAKHLEMKKGKTQLKITQSF